ncbi:hypothetical protein JI664_17270 [Rhodobacter sp. NTK016B]|uniref:hypothetical protein n=1 Tax=Rhodobacter sp. NTK016B TaxID=2759676 RepID=UPI001A8E8631|nr:hypothetical protein [Rhodobacter sp. NTK016B]MBN8293725.1 hypothetical protein [Rhodobacter sp. NTK016B]
MTFHRSLSACSLLVLSIALAGCVSTTAPDPTNESQFLPELPEGIMNVVGPNQDLTAVRIMPSDGCYWYRHTNVVETTFVPLRTRDGRMICTSSGAAPA